MAEEETVGEAGRAGLFVPAVAGVVFAVVIYTVFLFVPTWLVTGGIDWPRGQEFIIYIAALYSLQAVWMYAVVPELLRERLKRPERQPLADKFATFLLLLLIAGWLAAIPLDVHQLHLLPAPPPEVSYWGGLMILLLGSFFIQWTFHENVYAAPVVTIQGDRGQHVIDTGPYRFVRHPMYLGMIPFFAGMSLFMESIALTLCVFPLVVFGTLPRILIEERTLKKELPGYRDYMSRVRWRILPGVF